MHRSGFSRIDLAIVLFLGLTLLGLVLVFLPRQRDQGLRVQCMNNLRRIGEGVQSYHQRHDFLPPARIADGYATWAVLLAPYLAKDHLLDAWDLQERFVDQDEKIRDATMTLFFCPARNRAAARGADGALGDYAAVSGNGDSQHPWTGSDANGPMILGEVLARRDDLILEWRGRVGFHHLKRGLSNTLLIGEKHVPEGGFGEAANGDGSLYDGRHPASFARVAGPGFGLAQAITDPMTDNFGSAHPGFCHFLVADGGVRLFTIAADPAILGKLTTRE
jgi:hypothetical protein